ncbi:MAG: hypothetical protein KGJ06_00730 [Pseudomonadota bacterium]|nr:hypothetical protein [Pseudomonadota bacterium]
MWRRKTARIGHGADKRLDDTRWPPHELNDDKRIALRGVRSDLLASLDKGPIAIERAKTIAIAFFDQLGADRKTAETIAELELAAAYQINSKTITR